jgi:hypothetical protein
MQNRNLAASGATEEPGFFDWIMSKSIQFDFIMIEIIGQVELSVSQSF